MAVRGIWEIWEIWGDMGELHLVHDRVVFEGEALEAAEEDEEGEEHHRVGDHVDNGEVGRPEQLCARARGGTSERGERARGRARGRASENRSQAGSGQVECERSVRGHGNSVQLRVWACSGTTTRGP